jgi:hypothetical protein
MGKPKSRRKKHRAKRRKYDPIGGDIWALHKPRLGKYFETYEYGLVLKLTM